jgi:hypothetical protein
MQFFNSHRQFHSEPVVSVIGMLRQVSPSVRALRLQIIVGHFGVNFSLQHFDAIPKPEHQ